MDEGLRVRTASRRISGGYLILVGRVERDLADLFVACTELGDMSNRKLDAFQQSGFRCVSITFPVKDQ